MQKRSSKRKKQAQLAFIYSLMTVTVIMIVTVLVLVMQGYRFNRFDGKVEQGGLVQFDSKPNGASVDVDTVRLANQTPNKITVTAGEHTFTLSKPGYTTWKKTTNIVPGTVLWLNYIRLFPATPIVQDVATLNGVDSSLPSPDHNYLATIPVAGEPVVVLTRTNSDTVDVVRTSIPLDMYTVATDPKSQQFVLKSWDRDNRYVIIQHNYDGQTEFLSYDTRGSNETKNISKSLGVDAKKVVYQVGHSDIVYILTANGELRRGHLGNVTLSGPLVANVQDFNQFDESLLTYTTGIDTVTKQRSVGYLTNGASKSRTVRSYTDDGSAPLSMRIGKYYGDHYLVIAYGQKAEIYDATIPSSDAANGPMLDIMTTFDTPGVVRYTGFAPGENRFVYAQTDTSYVAYDLEWEAKYTTPFAATPTRELDWEDGFHTTDTTGGSLAQYDYDGTNKYIVSSGVADKTPALSNNSKYLYYYTVSGETVKLVRQKLTVD